MVKLNLLLMMIAIACSTSCSHSLLSSITLLASPGRDGFMPSANALTLLPGNQMESRVSGSRLFALRRARCA